ncbi:hypothetical protein BDN72DRAFT_92685 [Pluteus cervinus]|uniref:Uncharacterized protein n=1 Tax=Pluteus cervinus TaxID=181527 RepID=A0ACD3AP96_9AGAR|nr:hypothetical protein BDN72DRAFT_92685 [Pluteus cervinus]
MFLWSVLRRSHVRSLRPPDFRFIHRMALLPGLQPYGVASIWAETLLYGVYVTLFCQSAFISFGRLSIRSLSAGIFTWASLFIYVLASVHIALALYCLLQDSVCLAGTPEGTTDFFEFERWERFLFNFISTVVEWITELLLIFRCYILWGQNVYIILPSCIVFVASVGVNIAVYHWWVKNGVIGPGLAKLALNSLLPLGFVQTIGTTGLIAFRIIHQHQESRASGIQSSRYRLSFFRVGRVMVDSAVLSGAQFTAAMILYAMNHPGQCIAIGIKVPITGIAFHLITIRMHSMYQSVISVSVEFQLTDGATGSGMRSQTNQDCTISALSDSEPGNAPAGQ